MWISRQMTGEEEKRSVEPGKITMNSDGDVEAVSTGVQRNVNIYSPYGYSYSTPRGTNMLLAENAGGQAAIGAVMQSRNLQTGEIKITALSGAYIYLKNDGSVVINGLKINRNGVIENGS